MVQSGQVPDVAEVPDKWVGLYGSLNKLVDLTPYLNQTDASKNYTDLTWTAAKSYKGTPYVIPYGFYIRALYYNKALFKQAGISLAARHAERLPQRLQEDQPAPRQVRLLHARKHRRLR